MRESKIQINERKIRNGARKTKEREQRLIMEKLSTEYRPDPFADMQITMKAVTAKTRTIKDGWTIIDDEIQKHDSPD